MAANLSLSGRVIVLWRLLCLLAGFKEKHVACRSFLLTVNGCVQVSAKWSRGVALAVLVGCLYDRLCNGPIGDPRSSACSPEAALVQRSIIKFSCAGESQQQQQPSPAFQRQSQYYSPPPLPPPGHAQTALQFDMGNACI